MRTRSLVLIIGLLTLSLVLIVVLRWLALSHVRNLSNPRMDQLQGMWQITWDQGTADEMSGVLWLDRVSMRRYSFYVTDGATVTFFDDEGCFHRGQVEESGRLASGQYGQCPEYPDWIGTWKAVKR